MLSSDRCPHCNTRLPRTGTRCPVCGAPVSRYQPTPLAEPVAAQGMTSAAGRKGGPRRPGDGRAGPPPAA